MPRKLTYKTAGVDIKKADAFVGAIKGLTSSMSSKGVLKRKGSFGGLVEIDKSKFRNPVLVSSTDGVGTKLLIAKQVGKHDTVGIDLVAMNVNDILCVGAKPLFFMDYIACGKLNPKELKNVMRGIVKGCQQSRCPLIGGETAEMPGLYKGDDYDLAGFTVGIVEKSKIIDGSTIKTGDRLIGLASSGLHSNGFSLVRKVFSPREQKKRKTELLKPTKIYVEPVLKLLNKVKIKGIAHVTGGAFYDKVTKIVPSGKCFNIDKTSWTPPKIFREIQKRGRVTDKEMYRTFNMGIGLVLAVSKKDVKKTLAILKRYKVKSWEIGEVINNRNRKIQL